MVKLSLTLKSNQPSLIYSSDGKVYRLLPGANTLSLDYDSYVALAKTLNINPIKSREEAEEDIKPEVKEEPVEEVKEEEVKEEVKEEPVEEVKEEPTEDIKSVEEVTKESAPEEQTEEVTEPVEEVKEEPVEESVTEPVPEEVKEEPKFEDAESPQVDYSSMSYNKLKSLYKSITGKSCKLKKDELVDFLKENNTNV